MFRLFTSALLQAWFLALAVGAYSVLAIEAVRSPYVKLAELPIGALEAAVTLAVSMLLIFRTNRAYERWWEARTLWGTLVNVSRNLAVKAREIVRPDADERAAFADLIVTFCKVLRIHLRGERHFEQVGVDADPLPRHVPSYIVGRLYDVLSGWNQEGRLSDEKLRILDRELRVFLDVCGACERIRNTPVAVSWRTLVRQVLLLYVIALPWGLADDFQYWTIPMSILISYAVIAGEAIAHYIEEPFGKDEDHLQLEAICAAIETSVREILESEPAASVEATDSRFRADDVGRERAAPSAHEKSPRLP
jgi:putative membrane protein